MFLQVSVLPDEGSDQAQGAYAQKKTFWEKRAMEIENITTPRGIHLRLCRSIQAEGAFALLKNDFGFCRFLTIGRVNVRTEMFFFALGLHPEKAIDKAGTRAASNPCV